MGKLGRLASLIASRRLLANDEALMANDQWQFVICHLSFVIALMLCLVSSGCVLAPPSQTMAPRAYRHYANPWGPGANEARLAGKIPPFPVTPEMNRWAEFGREHIKDGDILLRMGRTQFLGGFDFSRAAAHLSHSHYSHSGIACWKNGGVWVYDYGDPGCQCQPFEVWMLDAVKEQVAILRLRAEHQDRIPLVLEYCEKVHNQNIPFDMAFSPGEEAYYCLEFTEMAYRSAGIKLCDAIPVRELPNYEHYGVLCFLLEKVTSFRRENPVYVPGNESLGLCASNMLEKVYPADSAAKEAETSDTVTQASKR